MTGLGDATCEDVHERGLRAHTTVVECLQVEEASVRLQRHLCALVTWRLDESVQCCVTTHQSIVDVILCESRRLVDSW